MTGLLVYSNEQGVWVVRQSVLERRRVLERVQWYYSVVI